LKRKHESDMSRNPIANAGHPQGVNRVLVGWLVLAASAQLCDAGFDLSGLSKE